MISGKVQPAKNYLRGMATGQRYIGWDAMAARLTNKGGCNPLGKGAKRETHKRERRAPIEQEAE